MKVWVLSRSAIISSRESPVERGDATRCSPLMCTRSVAMRLRDCASQMDHVCCHLPQSVRVGIFKSAGFVRGNPCHAYVMLLVILKSLANLVHLSQRLSLQFWVVASLFHHILTDTSLLTSLSLSVSSEPTDLLCESAFVPVSHVCPPNSPPALDFCPSPHLNLSISPLWFGMRSRVCSPRLWRCYVSLHLPLYFPLDRKTDTHKEEFKQELKMKSITFIYFKLK